MSRPKALILRTAGTNCDQETAFAFSSAGAQAELLHVNKLIDNPDRLKDYQILALPGGFTYGDDIAAGRILANELRYKLSDELKRFISEDKLIIGICNGFQVLVKSGLLPDTDSFTQKATLAINDSAKFEDRWVYLKTAASKCIWTRNLPEIIYLPVAHGEGKFITRDKEVMNKLRANNQIVFQYCNKQGQAALYPDNPNGSEDSIAGICDNTGRIFGLMPHPERHIFAWQHPQKIKTNQGDNSAGDGSVIFKNAVKYIEAKFKGGLKNAKDYIR